MIAKQIQILFASYRKADYADPEGFIASLGMVLQQYPDEVIRFVTSPQTGIQRTVKFPPTIPEVVSACDERVAWLKRAERFQTWGTSRDAGPARIEPPREKRSSYAELKAKYGENWGISGDEPKAGPSAAPAIDPAKLVEHYRNFDLGFRKKI